MEKDTGRLCRRYREGEAGLAGQLDDYAFLVQALLDLYEADFDVAWLDAAEALSRTQIALFRDAEGGGFFDAGAAEKNLLVRMKSDYDGAEPTGNSIAALNLLRLCRITANEEWQTMAEHTIAAFASRLKEYPPILPQMLIAYDFSRRPLRQLVLVGEKDEPGTRQLLDVVHQRFLPDTVVLLADEKGGGRAWLARRQPLVAEMQRVGGRPTAYLCQDYTCGQPTSEPRELEKQLDSQTRMGKGGGHGHETTG
ncbi:MAG TPA: hypothetical protein VLL73_03805 [Desulfurivibrionaceae bacterium]|nr:hypothetical protein [Desulfurivibrionaceae bacterium]